MKITFLLIIAFCLGIASPASAQYRYGKRSLENASAQMTNAYLDSLRSYKVKQDSVYARRDSLPESLSGNSIDGRFYRLFTPLTFFHSVAGDILRIDRSGIYSDKLNSEIDSVLITTYLSRPDKVEDSEGRLAKVGKLKDQYETPVHHNVELTERVEQNPIEADTAPIHVLIRKPNFWKFAGDYYLQFLQNYVSENWYKGGESNYSMLGSVTLQANYNNKQKVKFENKLEMKLGFQSTNGDTLRTFRSTDDMIRYTGKLGLQATRKWYYTLQLIAQSQFMRGYKSNETKVYSDFLSPLNVNLSIGMDYSVNWLKNRLTGNIHLAPLAYNMRYVGRQALATNYGLEEGKKTLNDYGSEFTFDLKWNVLDNFSWQTRLYGYTTYERFELEWENTLTFQFNRYISCKLFLYPRFDDGTNRDAHHGYWQFKEFSSLGFSYSF